MKRIMITLFMLGVFTIAHAQTNPHWYKKYFPPMVIEYWQPGVEFMFDEYFTHYECGLAENALYDLLTKTYGLEEGAYAHVEPAEGQEFKVYVDIFISETNYGASDRIFNIDCDLFQFYLIQKGLEVQDPEISQSGSLEEGNACIVFYKQADVGYYLYCNDIFVQEIPYYLGAGRFPRSIPVTQDGVYTLEAYVPDYKADDYPHTLIQGPRRFPGSANLFDHLTPSGGIISGLSQYYRGITNTVAVISNSSGSGGPEAGDYVYSWETRVGSSWEVIPNQSDMNCTIDVSGRTDDICIRRRVTKGGRVNYSNVHEIKCQKTPPVYVNPNSVTKTVYTSENATSQMQSVEYFDGLGRLMQTVQVGATPTHADLVSHQEYDSFGRESNSWLPVSVGQNNGAFVPVADFINMASNTYVGDLAPYSKPFYEASPLNRIEQQFGPGHSWYNNSGSVKTAYMTNVAGNDTLNCIHYTVSDPNTQSILLTRVGDYNSNELYVTRIEDEDRGVQFHFKDKLDNLILVRQLEKEENGRQFADTYYIYDVYKNRRVVLPPLASEQLASGSDWSSSSTASLSDYAYLYKYDERNRCIAKKLPGADWTYFIYDHADRMIFSQDGEQRSRNEWFFSIPDVFSRESVNGLCSNSYNPFGNPLDNAVVNAQRDLSMDIYKGYMINGVTLSNPVVLTANYYDNYAFKVKDGVATSTNSVFYFESLPDFDAEQSSGMGLPTGSVSARLTGVGSNISPDYDYTVMYYDNEERLIQTRSTNHLGGYDHTFTAYNFVGQPTLKRHIHSAPGQATQNELYTYSYDHAGRLLTVRHKLNNGSEIALTDNEYDELGRLKKNKRNGQAGLTTSYDYNIRSWVQDINNTHFVENLSYTFGGNIQSQQWQQAGKTRKYEFGYDLLSRLTSARYTGDGDYNTDYAYDKHGNITNLSRWGNTGTHTYGLVDSLTMSYRGNQLTGVEDSGVVPNLSFSADFRKGSTASTQYAYDANGNMKCDLNKGISDIEYNFLNLPSSLSISNSFGSATNSYVYSATGSKLRVDKGSCRTDYVGNVIYEQGLFKRLLVEGGYYDNETRMYYFYIQDHLGNNRIVANQNSGVVQSTQYYPFGMAFADNGSDLNVQPYKYGGKELDSDNGLNWYDYSARWKGDWFFPTMDPLAEDYYEISPYVYAKNNPFRFVDPTGMQANDTIVNGGILETLEVIAPHREPVTGFLGHLEYFWTGGNYDGFKYNMRGEATALSPIGGVPSILPSKVPLISWKKLTEIPKIVSIFRPNYKSVKDVIDAAGKLVRLKHGIRQGVIKGDINTIFNDLAKGHNAVIQVERGEKFFKAGSIRVGMHMSTRGGGNTLHINDGGQLFKIRVE